MAKAPPGEYRLTPTKIGDPGRLVLARLRISCFRVHDLAQGRLTVNHKPAITDVPAQVPRLVGIGLEVEQLRRHPDIVHVLELTLADHEGSGGGAGRMILAHDGTLWRRAAHDIHERCAREVAIVGMSWQSDAVDDGR